MKIESIRVQGYRSLGDLTFKPGAFTVLVGPNNAGKSNIVDALGFLSDVYAHGIRQALDVRGGFENVAFRESSLPQRQMSFEVVVSAEPKEIFGFPPTMPLPDGTDFAWLQESGRIQLQHRFVLQGLGDSLVTDFAVKEDRIQLDQLGDSDSPALRIERRGATAKTHLSSSPRLRDLVLPFFHDATVAAEIVDRTARTERHPRELIANRLQNSSPVLASLLEHLGEVKIYQLLPPTCRIPSPATPMAHLGRHGENLAALVYYLKEQFPETWKRVLQDMELIFQDLTDIAVVPTTDRRWTLVFKEEGLGRQWSADEVSDGTILALALFSTLHDPRGSLLAIEEPENSLHPWIVRVLVDACRKISSQPSPQQIVLTTHSPVVIDRMCPPEVMVVTKEDGQTKLEPLLDMEPNVEQAWEEGKIDLSGLLDSGLVREAVPIPSR